LRGSGVARPAVSSVNSFHELSSRLSAEVGIAIASVGSSPVSLGTWSSGVAWSTSKVPLVIAALRVGVGSHQLVAQTIAPSGRRDGRWPTKPGSRPDLRRLPRRRPSSI
jgi:hypothetical protein